MLLMQLGSLEDKTIAGINITERVSIADNATLCQLKILNRRNTNAFSLKSLPDV